MQVKIVCTGLICIKWKAYSVDFSAEAYYDMHRGDRMRILRQFGSMIQKMEHSSIIIIKIGCLLCSAAYIAAAVFLIILTATEMDYTTGLYWITQLSVLGGRLLLACTFPVFIIELIYLNRGCK